MTDVGCLHMPMVVGNLKPRDLPDFKWVNTMLGNLKTTLSGAFHALKYSKYGENYLAAFAYRFNRRFDLRALVARLIVDVARAKPIREATIRTHAEPRYSSGCDLAWAGATGWFHQPPPRATNKPTVSWYRWATPCSLAMLAVWNWTSAVSTST